MADRLLAAWFKWFIKERKKRTSFIRQSVLKFAWKPKSRSWRFFLLIGWICQRSMFHGIYGYECCGRSTWRRHRRVLKCLFLLAQVYKSVIMTLRVISHHIFFFCVHPLFICTLHCMLSIDCYWTQPIIQLLKSIYGDQQQQQEKVWTRNKALTASTALTSTTKNEYIISITWRRHSISCFFSYFNKFNDEKMKKKMCWTNEWQRKRHV